MNRAMVVALATVFLSAPALAGLSGRVGWTDENSITWQGVSELKTESPDHPGTFLWADVEWVVEWDSGAGQFHYMYQLTSKGEHAVALFAIPMLPSNEAINIGAFSTGAGDVAPSLVSFEPAPPAEATMASWYFDGLQASQTSYALDYWSVNKPLAIGGFIQDSTFAVTADLPSPDNLIPEPASLSLLAAAALVALRRRRK
ncbi:MAG: PEP-CTERM sorting domain-containing protein [Planctomycetota bacterium]|nr:PEP-CTERM sorting domain-containing protein [Planctomycetota bacterium]